MALVTVVVVKALTGKKKTRWNSNLLQNSV
jgi:hypothetical protein